MAILVDDAIWPWRGDRWAHLCSDEGLDELHAFAYRLGVRRMAFQGDHYDVHVEQRRAALAAGAVAVGSRELLRRLRGAGLRVRAGHGAWHWTPHLDHRLPADGSGTGVLLDLVATLVAPGGAAPDLPAAFERLGLLRHEVSVRVASRPAEVAVVVSGPGLEPVVAGDWGEATVVHHPPVPASSGATSDLTPGERSVLEVFIRRAVPADV